MNRADGGFAEPALTAQFPRGRDTLRHHRIGQFRAQVKIAANAFVVGTIKAEHRPGVVKVDRVFDFAAPVRPVRVVEGEVDRQGFQLRKPVRDAVRIPCALAFLLAVFRARPDFLMMHNVTSPLAEPNEAATLSKKRGAVCNNRRTFRGGASPSSK